MGGYLLVVGRLWEEGTPPHQFTPHTPHSLPLLKLTPDLNFSNFTPPPPVYWTWGGGGGLGCVNNVGGRVTWTTENTPSTVPVDNGKQTGGRGDCNLGGGGGEWGGF